MAGYAIYGADGSNVGRSELEDPTKALFHVLSAAGRAYAETEIAITAIGDGTYVGFCRDRSYILRPLHSHHGESIR